MLPSFPFNPVYSMPQQIVQNSSSSSDSRYEELQSSGSDSDSRDSLSIVEDLPVVGDASASQKNKHVKSLNKNSIDNISTVSKTPRAYLIQRTLPNDHSKTETEFWQKVAKNHRHECRSPKQ